MNKMASDTEIRIFNQTPPKEKGPVSAVKLSQELQKAMLRLKGECMEEDGRGVDYEQLKSSPAFAEYKEKVSQLHLVNLDSLTSEHQKMAFFINLYNALTLHGLAELDAIPDSVLDERQFWNKTCYKIGEHVYSLDDIEHGILRGNKPHPAADKPPFSEKDPRLKYKVNTLDPRIHFALVCGAVSCPPINVYDEKNLDNALTLATKNFCRQEVSMFTESGEVWLSKIFLWYQCDFGLNDVDVINWLEPYLEKDIQERQHILLFKLKFLGKVKIKYNEYDWRLNRKGLRPINL